jgi:hypothetical protein
MLLKTGKIFVVSGVFEKFSRNLKGRKIEEEKVGVLFLKQIMLLQVIMGPTKLEKRIN